jgi:CheY-like chemotaxis protein
MATEKPVADENPSQKIPREIGRLRILVAEDGLVNQKLATALLQKLGHTVTLAENGQQAVDKWQESPEDFDLILMDVLMPELDGIEATQVIRKLEQATGRQIPIIAVTAQAMKGDRETCLAAGMDDYMSKPIRQATLEEVIARLLG